MTTKHPGGIVAIGMLIIGLFFGYLIGFQQEIDNERVVDDQGFQESSAAVYQLMVDYGNDTISTVNDAVIGESDTVLSGLQRSMSDKSIEVGIKEYNGLGTLVTKIGSQENGGGKKYWQYWVNGKHPDVGADKYLLKPGDVVEWKFTSATES